MESAGKRRAASVDLPEPAAPTRTTRHGCGSRITTRQGPSPKVGRPCRDRRRALRGPAPPSRGLAPRLPTAALARPDLVRGLVVDGRALDDVAMLEPVSGVVPRALDHAVDDLALVERPAGMGAR